MMDILCTGDAFFPHLAVTGGSLSSLVARLGQRKSENRRKVKEGNHIKPLWGCIKYPEVGSSNFPCEWSLENH
jgi:hypothetical protein